MSDRELSTEKNWLERARVDPERFLVFYEKYRDGIYRFLLLKTRDEDVARDLTAETFLLAQERLWKFRWQGLPFGAWLFRIALNLVRQHHRAAGRNETVPLESVAVLPDGAPSALDNLVMEEEHRVVYESLSVLDDANRTIFLLHYWMEHTTAEVAAIVGMPEGTVKSRLVRGRRKLWIEIKERRDSEPAAGGNGERMS